MTLLESYEQQYAGLIAETTALIYTYGKSTNGTEKNELRTKIDGSLTEAQELLEQIGLEIRDLSSAQKASATSKFHCAQAELKRLQMEYKKSQNATNVQTAIDFGSDLDYYDDVSISNDQRQRLLDNSERIERTGNRLMEAFRVSVETEQIGAEVLTDLHHQRETMQTARNRLRETNAELGRASRTLNTMMLRALREKFVLYTVGACFVIAVIVSLYLTFSSGGTDA